MFPVGFVRMVVEGLTSPGEAVLDPFCGRGTVPFVSQAIDRAALGIDLNPVAWVFSKVKTSPETSIDALWGRLEDVIRAIQPNDKKAEHEFQTWAWSPGVLGFLNAARRILDWRNCTLDRTLLGFVLVHVHAKLGDGISNQMHKARAMGPDYSVRWWKERAMKPPEINVRDYFQRRIEWRYRHGVIGNRYPAKICNGDAQTILPSCGGMRYDLLFTSPPYCGVTDYRQDSWIRLWMLGEGPSLPDWKKLNGSGKESYRELLQTVFQESRKLLKPHSVVWIRTDARPFTMNATFCAMRSVWPSRKMYVRHDQPARRTQTALFGDQSQKPGEMDIVIPGPPAATYGP